MFKEIILITIGFLIFFFIVWLLYSRHSSMPCPTWLGWLIELDNPFSKISRTTTIIQHLELQPGMTVLDVGCGPGHLTIPAARKVGPKGKVVAMDIQARMLQRLLTKAQKANLTNITVLHAEVGEAKLKNNTFDRALLVSVLGEISNRKEALKNIYDALTPEGLLAITKIIFDPHYQCYKVVRQLAQEAGFQEKNVFKDFFTFTLILEKPIPE